MFRLQHRSRVTGVSPRFLGFALLAAISAPAYAQPAPPLTRFVPSKNLAFYAEFDGTSAHQAAWRATAAYKLLNETTLGELVKDLAAQALDARRAQMPPPGLEIVQALERLATQGFAVGLAGDCPPGQRFVVAIRGGGRPEYRDLIHKLIAANVRPPTAISTVKKGDRTITVFGTDAESLSVWEDQGDLVGCPSEYLATVLDVVDGKSPSVESHLVRNELRKDESEFPPIGIAFVDMSAIPKPASDLVKLGLEGLKRVELRFGFQNNALMSVLRIHAPAPRKGILELFDQPGFASTNPPPIPAGAGNFFALMFDPSKAFDRLQAIAKAGEWPEAGILADAEKAANDQLGLDLRGEILRHLGPEFVFHDRTKPDAAGIRFPYVNSVISIRIDDEAAVAKSLVMVMGWANRRLEQVAKGADGARLLFRERDQARPGYQLLIPPSLQPGPPFKELCPVVMLTKNRLVIAANPDVGLEACKLAEGQGERLRPEGPLAAIAENVPDRMTLLSINEPRDTFPQLVAGLPGIVESMNSTPQNMLAAQNLRMLRLNGGVAPRNPFQINIDNALIPEPEDLKKRLFPGILVVSNDDQGVRIVIREALPNFTSPSTLAVATALMFPAVKASRDAARRARCVNHLKQIGLAMHNFHSANDSFPKAAITDKQGKPLLSWRVAILPYLGFGPLYNKFHMDEPWDSRHNIALLKEIPPVFVCDDAPKSEDFTTSYQAFVGQGALLEASRPTRIAEVTDGTSNTVMVVESKTRVPWTKPDDLAFEPDAAKPPIAPSSHHPGGFNVLFADGSVRFIKSTIPAATWRALITRSGGEVIDRNAIP